MAIVAMSVGATIKGAPDGRDYLGEIRVPGTMTRASTINDHKEKVRAERGKHLEFKPLGFAGSILPNSDVYENHAQRPMVGMLASVCVMTEGHTVFTQVAKEGASRGTVAAAFIRYLLDSFPNQFADTLRFGDTDPEAVFFGFNLKQVLRIAAFEILQLSGDDRVAVPVRLWHNPAGVYDPVDILLPANDRRDLDLYSLLRYFGIEATAQEVAESAERQAAVVSALVGRAQLA